MIEIKSILAATDFSVDSRHAVERGALLCASTDLVRGAALHVLESSWFESLKILVSGKSNWEAPILADASQSLGELVSVVEERTGYPLEPQVRVGHVLDAILDVSSDFDLIAVGAHGTHPLRDWTIGSTAQRLLRRTKKPILVVKRRPAAAYRRVLVAVDFSPYSRDAVYFADALAPQGELLLAHAFDVFFEDNMRHAGVDEEVISEYRVNARNEAEDKMRRFVQSLNCKERPIHWLIERGRHAATILRDKVHEIGADLVVVGKHGVSIAEDFLLGSVTLHLLAECDCDVLATQ